MKKLEIKEIQREEKDKLLIIKWHINIYFVYFKLI